MAPSLSNVKLFSVFVVDGISSALTRRGFSSAAAKGGAVANATKVRGGARSNNTAVAKKSAEEKSSSWAPDPVTGHYRPENRADEIDVAELRQTLLKHKDY